VLTATKEDEALQVAQKRPRERIDLLLTDVVMPKMSGADLVEQLRAIRPDIKVLLTSGYIDDQTKIANAIKSGAAFIEKPFRATALACKVRELMDK
jgi:response regulator RpfG family c-di-GMP phosphodiesterase